jgi:hypothetical protein
MIRKNEGFGLGIRLRDVIGGFIVLLALTGCATTGEQAFYARADSADSAKTMRISRIADTSDCNGDPSCVISAKAFAAFAEIGVGGGSDRPQQYVRQASTGERLALGFLGALPGFAQVWATIESGRNNVDIARIHADRDARRDDAWAGVATGVADAFGVAAQTPTYQIGGDYITGTQHVGDSVGRDQISGQQHIGDWRTGDNIARDTIGRDRTDYGTGNRLNSPGPYRDVGNEGPRCAGIGCQTTNPPVEPEPEE